jgi:hypothetical protein
MQIYSFIFRFTILGVFNNKGINYGIPLGMLFALTALPAGR